MKKQVFFTFYLFISLTVFAQKHIKLSLLTYDTGFESHSIFGHTALRVQNKKENTDIVYNFGIFDFNTPNFLMKFAGGRLDYRLGIQDFEQMLLAYEYDNRQVFEQKLNLNNSEVKKIIARLEFLYQPENRYYRYGFLKRNCSTEIRDIFIEHIDNIEYTPTDTDKTYRNYLDQYAKVTPWFNFGINLALGSPIDTKITTYDLMFLPDYLSEEMKKATINAIPFAEKQKKLLPNLPAKKGSNWSFTPLLVFCLLFIFLILGNSRVLRQTFTFAVASAGVVILVTSLFSAHPEVQKNYNLLWCNPLYFINFGLCFTSFKKFHRLFAALMLLSILAMFGVWIYKIQGLDLAFIPICVSLIWINLKHMQRS